MHETDLHLEPNEASDLCPVFDTAELGRRGWDRAFLTVLDEAPVEEALAVLAHDDGAAPDERWQALRVPARALSGEGRTEDAESCARRDGWIYVLGSQFGDKEGPLAARRSWIARVSEASLVEALDGGRASVEVARLRFGLHRAVNDVLVAAGLELIAPGSGVNEAYIAATIAEGEREAKRWAGRVTPADRPVNVEGADFRGNGRLLLGLRYPVTAAGHPILVEVEDVEGLFADPDVVPRCANVWVLEDVGSVEAPAGIRALHAEPGDRFDAIVGDLDAAGKGAIVLADHPEGGRAASAHIRFVLPLTAAGGPVPTEHVHDFGDVRRVEGVAVHTDGHAHYVIDEDGHVALRTLVFA